VDTPPSEELGGVEVDVGVDEEVGVEVGFVDEEDDVLLGPSTAAIVIAPEVPQHAVLLKPQHQVVEVLSSPQGFTAALLLPSCGRSEVSFRATLLSLSNYLLAHKR
jgi:hypothetical protein